MRPGEDLPSILLSDMKAPIYLEPRSKFDEAITAIKSYRMVYSREKILKVFMDGDDMDRDEAVEFYDYNVMGTFDAMDNPNKPIFIE